MNPVLAVGQIIVSIALIVADPAAGPRDRAVRARSAAIRPCIAAGAASSVDSGSSRSSCSSCSRLLARVVRLRRRRPGRARRAQPRRTSRRRSMNRIDRAVVGGLVLLLALDRASSIAAPAFGPHRGDAEPQPIAGPSAARRTSRASSAGPTRSARWPPGPRPIATSSRSSSGASSALGPDGTLVRDLAERWNVDDDRPDVDVPRCDPTPAGRTASRSPPTTSCSRSTSCATPTTPARRRVVARRHRDDVDRRTVRFELTTPLGGFLQAATQPIAPAHLLEGVPVERARRRSVRRAADRVRARIRLGILDDDQAVLLPATPVEPPGAPGADVDTGRRSRRDPLATPTPTAGRTSPSPEPRPPRDPVLRRPADARAALEAGGSTPSPASSRPRLRDLADSAEPR